MTKPKASRRQRMTRALGKGGRVVLDIASVGATMLSAICMLVFAVLALDGISLNSFKPTVEQIIRDRTGASDVTIGSIRMVRDRPGATPFRVTLTDVHLDQGEGAAMDIPSLSLRLGAGALLRGQAMPSYVEVVGADITIERQGGDISIGGTVDGGETLDLRKIMADARRAGFEGAVLRNARMSFINHETGAQMVTERGTASLWDSAEGYAFTMNVPYEDQDGRASLDIWAETNETTGGIKGEIVARQAPAGVILPLLLGGDQNVVLDAAVSGDMNVQGTLEKGLTDVTFSLKVGEGQLKVQDTIVPVDFIDFAGSLDPIEQTVSVTGLEYALGLNTGSLSGNAALNFDGFSLEEIDFDLVAENLVVETAGLLSEPLPIEDATVSGRFHLPEQTLFISELNADYFGARIMGEVEFALPREEGEFPGIRSSMQVDGVLTPQQVLRGWPILAGDGARSWVVGNLPKADLFNVVYRMDLPRGTDIGDEGVPDEALDLTFEARNATVIYVEGMTPITGLSATGNLRGNQFTMQAGSGKVGPVDVTGGSIAIDKFVPKGERGIFEVKLAGQLPDILAILDEEPLGYVTEAGLAPEDFSGSGTFRLVLSRPMLSYVPIEDYRFDGLGTFSKMKLDNVGPGFQVTEGEGKVTLTSRDLTIEGDLKLAGVPGDFVWRRKFGGNSDLSLVASATLDSRAADAVGLPLRRFVQGEISTTIHAQGRESDFHRIEILGDLTKASITSDDQQELKKVGEEGSAAVVINLGKDESDPIDLETIALSTTGVNIEGNAMFSPQGALMNMEFPRFYIENIANLSARINRSTEKVQVSLEGDYLFAGDLIETFLNQSDGKGGLPGAIGFDASLSEVALNGAVSLENVTLQGEHNGNQLRSLSATGQFATGGNVTLTVKDNDKGLGQDIRLISDSFGRLLEGFFGIASVTGGESVLTATALTDGPIVGSINATDIWIKDAPTIARLLSVGSLDGLANLLNDEGLNFSELHGDIQLEDGQLTLVDARLTGSSLGLSANGVMALGVGEIDVHGAVAPVYGVNSLFGELPGLGQLFVSREGEGLVAFGYRIAGESAAPTISVNTLTALTPGIFRRIFEPIVSDRPTTDELLTAAEEAAGQAEIMDYLSTPELLQEYEAGNNNNSPGSAQPR